MMASKRRKNAIADGRARLFPGAIENERKEDREKEKERRRAILHD
jgi:hypothetical protein